MIPCVDCQCRTKVTASKLAGHRHCSRQLSALAARLGVEAVERRRRCPECGCWSRTVELSVADLRLLLQNADLGLSGLPPEV